MSGLTLNRLHPTELGSVSAKIKQPGYDRQDLKTGIVHLGIGAFHRAHQAWYTEQCLNLQKDMSWGILGVSLRSATVQNQLLPQDCFYTVVEKDSCKENYHIIGAIKDVLVAPHDPQEVISRMVADETKIISLTVTEKGYCHNPSTGNLDISHPDIQFDLANIHRPKTAIGFICAALQQRQKAGNKAFTVLSCDNLSNNGSLLKNLILQFAEQLDKRLHRWLQAELHCPSTMVDRIVPATTTEDIMQLEQRSGYVDRGMVVTEPFSQWIIEDKFAGSKPCWEKMGALLVDDVTPYEEMKLRLLNGAHSIIAYLGTVTGHAYVADIIAKPLLKQYVQCFMTQAAESINAPAGIDIPDYQAQLLARFTNTALLHKTTQIAMDGSRKIPQRWLNTIRYRLKQGDDIDLLSFALATWIYHLGGKNEIGEQIVVSDPIAEMLQERLLVAGNDTQKIINTCLSVEAVFGSDLMSNTKLHSTVKRWYRRLRKKGAYSCVEDLLKGCAE